MSQFNIGHFSSFFHRAWNLVYTWVLIWLFKWFGLKELYIARQLLFSSNRRDMISMYAIQRLFMILQFFLGEYVAFVMVTQMFCIALMGKAGHLYNVSSGVRLGNLGILYRGWMWK
ncbi:uncharacterized protein Bfra_003070 [Botrytis fragariae]|uniref:Uncharacterized protein n=1 Tax=Botrytis fragariae TaxID=1964551 RepID=A0A8H6AZY7_9HELO|nr:uncharacterized protein Bfra_003070 [Botrytis fragariae]KAF5876664.1 hypothetical protein Bfra_003070 [Botrytis fragariae]